MILNNNQLLFSAHFLWKDMHGKTRSSIRPINTKQAKKERKDALNSQGLKEFF